MPKKISFSLISTCDLCPPKKVHAICAKKKKNYATYTFFYTQCVLSSTRNIRKHSPDAACEGKNG